MYECEESPKIHEKRKRKEEIKILAIHPVKGQTDSDRLAGIWLRGILDLIKKASAKEIIITNSHIGSFAGDEATSNSLERLSKDIAIMANSDLVVMAGDWREFRSCRLEREVAIAYGIPCVSLEGGFSVDAKMAL